MRAINARPSSHYPTCLSTEDTIFAICLSSVFKDLYLPRSHYPISVVYRNFSSLDSTLYFLGIVYQATDSNLYTNNVNELWFLLLKLERSRCFADLCFIRLLV